MSNTFVPQTLYENLQAKKKEFWKTLRLFEFSKTSVLTSKRTIQGIFIFNLAGKSKKTINAQQEAQKYPLCSSFYKFFTDRRTARIKVLTVYLLPGPI